MKKLVGILVIAGAIGGIVWAVRSPRASDGASDVAPAEAAQVPEVAPSVAPPATNSTTTDAGVALSADEEAVIRMYSEMGDVLQKHAEDCNAMADGVGKVIAVHDSEIKRVMTEAQKRGQQEARAADQRILAAGGAQMEHFRSVLDGALDKCSTELQPVLKRLTALRGD